MCKFAGKLKINNNILTKTKNQYNIIWGIIMKKLYFLLVLILSFSGSMYSMDYSWDLINALYRNDFEVIESIISSNIITMSESDKRVVMNYAINYSSGENTLKVCELLFKYNIRPTAFDLFTAINRNRQNNTVQFLIQNGAIPNGEILLLTMERQRFDLAKEFIMAGVDVNYQYSLSRRDADGMTSLLYASKWENLEIVKLLIEAGARINIQAVNGDTALSIARKNNNDLIYNYLLENGANELIVNIPFDNTGIVNTLENQTFNFQLGSYRLSGDNRFISFSGNSSSGSISYIDSINNRIVNGVYRITGNNIVISMGGNTFNYRITSNISFSGNGEEWIRTGN
jgi:hypothetical protein